MTPRLLGPPEGGECGDASEHRLLCFLLSWLPCGNREFPLELQQKKKKKNRSYCLNSYTGNYERSKR